MEVYDTTNKENVHTAQYASLSDDSLRACFLGWLSAGNARQYSPDSSVHFIDKISEYVLQRKMCSIGLWNITQRAVFKNIYDGLLNDKLFRITEKNAYRAFLTIGKLYLKFLKERPFAKGTFIGVTTVDPEVKTVISAGIDNIESMGPVVESVLGKHFLNGIRPNSFIDINKLKHHLRETGEEGILLSRNTDMQLLLNSIGFRHGEKVFVIPQRGKIELEKLLSRLIIEGNRLFYYDEFYDVHSDFLQGTHIFSSELLGIVLSKICPSLWYYKNYCQTDRNTTVESEILRCYETAVSLTYSQLKDRLPYVPIASIRQVLAYNGDFIWVNTGVYAHVHKIEFDKAECREICSKIEETVSAHGFASLASMDICTSIELNPELSVTAIRNGLFQTYLSDRYDKRGNIVTMKGTALNSVAVFVDFCRSHDRLTLDELLNYEKEINGSIHSQSLFVAYDNMVRVDRRTFIADSEIQFDVDAMDDAIALFVHGNVISLQTVTSFTSFPYIDGYPWNWFLLESYCRRFSKRFKFQCLSVNSRNVGAIFRKSAGFDDYIDVMASVVANSSVKLEEKAVGDFLFENKYVAQRTNAVQKVAAKARLLRERI
jgi:hypothetical protein